MKKNIVNAKIIPPDSPYNYVAGIWQEELMSQEKRLIVLHAHDGYGKTSCMAYCFEKMKTGSCCAWYLLDRKDNCPKQFMTYLTMSFERATGKKFGFEKYGENPEKELLELIYQFSYTLEELDRELIFFFDEIQNLVNEEILSFFEKLIEYTKSRVRFFFAGTGNLPSFLIKSLSSYKGIFLLRENELRMNQEQIGSILEKKGISDKGDLALFLCHKTQGVPLQVMSEIFRLLLGGVKLKMSWSFR